MRKQGCDLSQCEDEDEIEEELKRRDGMTGAHDSLMLMLRTHTRILQRQACSLRQPMTAAPIPASPAINGSRIWMMK